MIINENLVHPHYQIPNEIKLIIPFIKESQQFDLNITIKIS